MLALSLFGCAEPATHVTPEELEPVPIEPETEEQEEPLPIELEPEKEEAVVNANNELALDLYQKYKDKEGNVFFSPYSISTALAMTYEGAKGETADQIKDVFHYPETDVMRPGYASLYNEINKEDKNYQLHTANALWAQQDHTFLEEYFDIAKEYYGGEIRNMDFKNQPEDSRVTINKWVEDQTNDRIKDLIPPGLINPLTRLVLTNAIYFKGEWVKQFNEEETRDAEFMTPSGAVDAKMMQCIDEQTSFNYAEDDLLQMIELPYSGEELSMLVLLPKEDLSSVEEVLSVEKLSEWKGSLREQIVYLFMPRFKFETKYMMADTLKEMGMPLAFTPDADFSGMTGKKDLFISNVVHQAFVEVNEEGTEAAAATAVVMVTSAMPEMEIPVFRADHPFIFIIQQKETGNILFMGKVNDPSVE